MNRTYQQPPRFPRGPNRIRLRLAADVASLVIGALTLLFASGRPASAEPLHERIDAVVGAARLGPSAEICDDSQFLRRVYLDLVGVIPTADEARAFLADEASDKRAKLIDSLLVDERFAHHMRITFDVMLMERRTEKHVKNGPWRDYLLASFREGKPLDQLAREILLADPDDASLPAAQRFYLDREVQPHLVTRDIGRLMLGRDVQCAQCHDHPLIDDYAQEEYFGIFAFVNRSYLFNDKKNKKVVLAEKAEGDVTYASVFDKDNKYNASPRLPGRRAIDEPAFAKDEAYQVKPPKDGRGVPKFSRRRELAQRLTAGDYEPFNRNLANRLWAHMFGRGIVYPLDLHHAGNPPSHPELMSLLAGEVAGMEFNVGEFLRQIALSQAYQRSGQLPQGLESLAAEAEDALAKRQAELDDHLAKAGDARGRAVDLASQLVDSAEAFAQAGERVRQAEQAHQSAVQFVAEAEKKAQNAKVDFAAKATRAKDLAQALATKTEVAESSGEDSTEQFAKLTTSLQQASAELATALEALKTQQAALGEARRKEEAANTAVQEARSDANTGPMDELRRQREEAQHLARQAKQQADAARQCIADAEALLAVGRAAKDQADVEAALGKLQRRWGERLMVRVLKPLTPEQMTMSLYQATGDLPARVEVAEKAQQESADKAQKEQQAAVVPPEEIHRRAMKKVYNDLQSVMDEMAAVFAQGDGQPSHEYDGRATEALYLSNSSRVQGLVSGRLAQRLATLDAPAALAEELYLALFSRMPREEEVEAVTNHLQGRDGDRQQAAEEMIWGLLSSTEFRFSH